MYSLSNDPFRLQQEVRKAYLLLRKGLLTNDEFVAVVSESIRNTTAFSDREVA